MRNRRGKSGSSERFYILGLPNLCRWWLSHEIKRHLLLGRKAMTNLAVVVQSLSSIWLFVNPWTAAHQASMSFTISQAYSNSCSLSQWCHPIISSPVISFSSRLQSFPASESFPMSQLFPSGGLSIRASASPSVLPMNIQSWFLLGLICLISLQSKGLSRGFPSTTVQKRQFFGTQLSL